MNAIAVERPRVFVLHHRVVTKTSSGAGGTATNEAMVRGAEAGCKVQTETEPAAIMSLLLRRLPTPRVFGRNQVLRTRWKSALVLSNVQTASSVSQRSTSNTIGRSSSGICEAQK